MIEHATFDDENVILQPGDRLYFYTDGVIEALDASERSSAPQRLMAEIDRQRERPLRAGLDHVANLVRDWSGGSPAGRRVTARARADRLKLARPARRLARLPVRM
jgi:hypothetical protein